MKAAQQGWRGVPGGGVGDLCAGIVVECEFVVVVVCAYGTGGKNGWMGGVAHAFRVQVCKERMTKE